MIGSYNIINERITADEATQATSFDKPFKLVNEFSFQFIYFYLWAILVFPIIFFADKFRLERSKWIKSLSVHLIIALIAAFLHRTISLLMYYSIFAIEKIANGFTPKLVAKIIGGSFDAFVIYWLILGIYYSYDYYRQYQQQKIMKSELEAQLALAQLQALKMQLHPHFLFNTLHAISTLMEEDIKSARRMLTRLSDLLRQTLDNIGVQEVTLAQELDFLKSYLEIEKIRFQERLNVTFNIKSDTLNAMAPNLILQPLVENAIKHGISPLAKGGQIEISAWKDDTALNLQITDSGHGSSQMNSNKNNNGVGLTNTRKRLQQLYGDNFTFNVWNGENGGFKVFLAFPFKTSSNDIPK